MSKESKPCDDFELCGNWVPDGSYWCSSCKERNERQAELERKAAEYDQLKETNRSLLAEKAELVEYKNAAQKLGDAIYQMAQQTGLYESGHSPNGPELIAACDSTSDHVNQLAAQNGRLREAITNLPTGEWDNPGMGFSAEWDDYTAKRFQSGLLALLNESPAVSLTHIECQGVEKFMKLFAATNDSNEVLSGEVVIDMLGDFIKREKQQAQEAQS